MNQRKDTKGPDFACQNLDHKNEPIIGFCFNEECSKTSQICFKCFTTSHGKHQSDCLRFQEIQDLIHSQQEELEKLTFQNDQAFARVQAQKTKSDKYLNMYKSLLTNLDEYLNQGSYGQVRAELPTLKNWRSISQRQISKKNEIYVKLDEINKFSKSIDAVCDEFKLDKVQLMNQNSQLTRSGSSSTQGSKVQVQEMNALAVQSLKQAIGLYQQQKLDEALKFIDLSLTQNQDSAQTHFFKGAILSNQERNEEAIDSFNKAIRLDPNLNEQMYYSKAQCLYQVDQYEEALECLEKAISMNPKVGNFYFLKGQTLYQLDKYQESVTFYDKALELEPNKPNFLTNKGSALHKLELYAEELQCYEIALSQNPNLPSAWHNKGTALMELKNRNEAIKAFEKAIQLRPNFPQSYTYLGMCLQKEKRHEEAIARFDQSYQISQNDEVLLLKGNSLNALGKNDEALKLYNEVKQRTD